MSYHITTASEFPVRTGTAITLTPEPNPNPNWITNLTNLIYLPYLTPTYPNPTQKSNSTPGVPYRFSMSRFWGVTAYNGERKL